MNSSTVQKSRTPTRIPFKAGLVVVVILGLTTALLAPAAPYWNSARREYASGPRGIVRCFLDCVRLGYGAYRPRVNLINLAQSNNLSVLVKPTRLDMRSKAGMGECASIAENSRGTVLATWMMRDDRDRQTYKIYARRLSIDGKPKSSDFRVNTGASSGLLAHHVCLRVDSSGYFYVIWNAARGPGELVRGGAGIFMRVYNPDGMPAAPEVQVSPTLHGSMPELAMSTHGVAAAVWSDKGQIWGRLLSHGGPSDSPVRIDDSPPGALAEFPTIAFGEDGHLMAAWADTRGGGRDVYSRLLNRQLQPIHASIKVGDGPVPKAYFRLTSVVSTYDGYAVAWVRPGSQRGRWIRADGSTNGAAIDLLPSTSEVAVLARPDGGAWVSNGRSIRAWNPDRVEGEIRLLEPPSHPNELSLSNSREGIWLAWHDSLDERRIPGLGDNLYIMVARVLLRDTVQPGPM